MARGVAKGAAEVAESFVYLVEEAKSEADSSDPTNNIDSNTEDSSDEAKITEVTVE